MITEIRMYLAEKLLYWVLCITPMKHKNGRRLVRHIRDYAEEVIIEMNRNYEKINKA
jgi:hypothetical protein